MQVRGVDSVAGGGHRAAAIPLSRYLPPTSDAVAAGHGAITAGRQRGTRAGGDSNHRGGDCAERAGDQPRHLRYRLQRQPGQVLACLSHFDYAVAEGLRGGTAPRIRHSPVARRRAGFWRASPTLWGCHWRSMAAWRIACCASARRCRSSPRCSSVWRPRSRRRGWPSFRH